MKTITTAVTVLPAGHDLLSEMATTISIEEWPAIRAAIEQMFESCRSLGDAS